MTTTLPVPLEFRLPDGWLPASPEEAGAPGAAFIALNAATHGSGFTANITIDGEVRADRASPARIADESVRDLAATATVTVAHRQEVGGPHAPGLAQDLRITVPTDHLPLDLVQSQVYVVMPDAAGREAVIRLVLTATAQQFPALIGDFREFLSTVGPDGGAL